MSIVPGFEGQLPGDLHSDRRYLDRLSFTRILIHRGVRLTAQGTYLISLLKMNHVVEYDKNFKKIWSYDIQSPWAAIRSKNGNTLITDEDDVLTREVNPKKETVWELTKKDIPPQYWYRNAQSATRLANGNTIICSRGGIDQVPNSLK